MRGAGSLAIGAGSPQACGEGRTNRIARLRIISPITRRLAVGHGCWFSASIRGSAHHHDSSFAEIFTHCEAPDRWPWVLVLRKCTGHAQSARQFDCGDFHLLHGARPVVIGADSPQSCQSNSGTEAESLRWFLPKRGAGLALIGADATQLRLATTGNRYDALRRFPPITRG